MDFVEQIEMKPLIFKVGYHFRNDFVKWIIHLKKLN